VHLLMFFFRAGSRRSKTRSGPRTHPKQSLTARCGKHVSLPLQAQGVVRRDSPLRDVKDHVVQQVDLIHDSMCEPSGQIHSHPELGLEEHEATSRFLSLLHENGSIAWVLAPCSSNQGVPGRMGAARASTADFKTNCSTERSSTRWKRQRC